MLRYAALESGAIRQKSQSSSRSLIIRKHGFSSGARSTAPRRKQQEQGNKPLSSLELAFHKRLEQTKQQQKQKLGGRVVQQNQKPVVNSNRSNSGNNSKGGLSANLRQQLQKGSQQQQQQQQHANKNGAVFHRNNGQQHANGRQSASRPAATNLSQQLAGIQRNKGAASLGEMLKQKTSTQPKPSPGVGSITKMLNSVSTNQQKTPPARNRNPVGGRSIRDMLQPLSSSTEPRKDMTDVSNLREAFLKSIESNKQKQQQQSNSRNKSSHQQAARPPRPAWRREGAKGFRKRLQEEQREQMEKLEQQRKMRAAVNRSSGAFFMTQEDYIQEQADQANTTRRNAQQDDNDDDKQVMLPPREATITELSSLFRVKIDDLTKMLKSLGERPRGEDHLVDLDVMELLAMECGLEPIRSSRRRSRPDDDYNVLMQRRAGAEATDEHDEAVAQAASEYDSLPPRPPVVCIMGHVDHGKTTLMDALRQKSRGLTAMSTTKKKKSKKNKKAQSNKKEDDAVAGTEAGGITQVISAFQVPLENQETAVTFLDTPGHAAFRSMRESGSNAADVIVLVVAADDGVSPQTVEIINFYKSIVKGAGGGGISMVVAMTKIDKHGIDVDESRQRIENQLLEHGIFSESFGSSGDSEYGPPVQVIPVSGLTGEGLDDLIEGLVLQSEIMDLRADEKAQGEGIVMDARMEKGVGVVADCIVRWGSLERGSILVSGVHSGKVKALKDMNGATIKKAVPSQPVRILGFKTLPKAGDPIICVHSEEVADQITERREALQDAEQSSRTSSTEAAEMQIMGTAAKRGTSLEATLVKYGQDGDADDSQIRIPVIIRADGEGSLAALKESLVGVGDESSFDLVVDPINSGIGPISATDVRMAVESGASIFSFGVKQNDKAALAMAEAEQVEVRSHDVIYSLLDEAKEVFAEHLPASPVEVVHGKAKVQAIFDVNNKKDAERIAGLAVLDGTLYKGMAKASNGDRIECHYRVLRNGEPVSSEGESLQVSSLRKVKEDVDDVRRGEECGLGLLDYTDYEKGDIIECYSIEMKREFV